jgi:hypothetical protein
LSPKRDAFTLFQSETSIFHDEETSSTSFPDAKKARMVLQQSPKSKPPSSKTKKTMTDKQENKLTGMQNLKIQKFKIFILTHTHTKKSNQRCSAPRYYSPAIVLNGIFEELRKSG